MKILGVDYGTKNIGLAVTDEDNFFATALESIKHPGKLPLAAEQIALAANQQNCDTILMGSPLGLEGKPTQMSLEIDKVVDLIKKSAPQIEIVVWNESYSTQAAQTNIRLLGNHKRDKDSESAKLILLEYLEFKRTGI